MFGSLPQCVSRFVCACGRRANVGMLSEVYLQTSERENKRQ